MKKFFKTFLTSLLIVLLFRLALGIIISAFGSPGTDIQFPYYESDLLSSYSPQQSVWAHFDGIHYLRLAQNGYRDAGSQAFFPLYPLLINFFSPLFPSHLVAALAIDYLALTLAITGIFYLFSKFSSKSLLSLLLFPTSFFLISVYNESLFLALLVWFFVCLKEKKWFLASLLAGLASGTRFIGILLSLSLLISLWKARKSKHLFNSLFLLLLSITGFLLYIIFLTKNFGDPFLFFHVQPLFGAERVGQGIVLLPQVLYRYGKILFTADPHTALYARAVLELGLFSYFFTLLLSRFHKLSRPVFIFLLLALLIPTATGTLSSIPRYLLVLVPWLAPRKLTTAYVLVSTALLIWCLYLFTTGIFIS